MALITSGCAEIRILDHQIALITSGCVPCRRDVHNWPCIGAGHISVGDLNLLPMEQAMSTGELHERSIDNLEDACRNRRPRDPW